MGYLSCKYKSSKLDLPQGWFSLYTQLFRQPSCEGLEREDFARGFLFIRTVSIFSIVS